MDPFRGRNIQAYHDGHELVLHKSKLFDFSTAETAPFELFMRHLACVPVGNTKKFPEPLQTEDIAGGDIIPMDPGKFRAQQPGIPSFEPPSPKEPRPDQHLSLPISLKGKESGFSLSPGNATGNGD